jgi:16S rRNA (guanine(966)-N(2))-methyltransferase RsmD
MKPRRASAPRQPPSGRAEGRGPQAGRPGRNDPALRPPATRGAGGGKPPLVTSAKAPGPAQGAAGATARATAGAPAEVRIVGGRWKRSKLPVADKPGLRPTPDRVRETLFNWLGQDLAGWRVLDAFAGSGALGFEAASRGAAEVLLVEADGGLATSLEATRQRLTGQTVGDASLAVQRGDALAVMRALAAGPRRFELVLLDPPFEAGAAGLFEQALRAALGVLAEGGLVYLEADRAYDAEALAALGCAVWKQARAGRVHVHLLQRVDPAVAGASTGPDGPLAGEAAAAPSSPAG